jgi:methionyl-tRNA synthetase
MLPVELARAANSYIDQTKPWALEKDPAQAQQLDTVLNLCVQACKTALAALLPILPDKAAAGLRQLNVDSVGATLEALPAELPAGHALGQAEVLFPRII